MEKIIFVDANLHPISENSPHDLRYAIDLGVRSWFAGHWLPEYDLHHFVSATPWKKHVNKKDAYAFLREIKKLNPDVIFGLLELNQLYALNRLGYKVGFEITDCWTCSTCDDWHGRVDGYYSLTNGETLVDWGENETDVHIVFGFKPGEEKKIIFPTE